MPCSRTTWVTGITSPLPLRRRLVRVTGRVDRAAARSRSMPRATATLGLLSPSMTRTFLPRRARRRASVEEMVVFPAPPLPARAIRSAPLMRRPRGRMAPAARRCRRAGVR